MNILAWFNPTRWLILVLAIAALTAGYFGWASHQQAIGEKRATDRYELALGKQKAEASTTLNAETTKVLTAERALQDFKNTQEIKDVDHRKTVSGLADQLRLAAGVAVRLRDPNAAPGCRLGSGGPTSPSAAPSSIGTDDRTETSGLFSVGATELFQRLTREADEVNNAFASCKAYASKVSENLTQIKE